MFARKSSGRGRPRYLLQLRARTRGPDPNRRTVWFSYAYRWLTRDHTTTHDQADAKPLSGTRSCKDAMELSLLLFCEEVLTHRPAHAAARMRNKSGKCSDSWLMAFEGRPSSRLHPGQAPDWRLGSRIQLQQRNCFRFSRNSFHRSVCYISAKN